jgi:hypothetical protein
MHVVSTTAVGANESAGGRGHDEWEEKFTRLSENDGDRNGERAFDEAALTSAI